MDETWFTQKRIVRWGGGGVALYIFLALIGCSGPIAADSERRAKEILQLGGHHWATVEGHGRGMAIKGVAPSEAAGAAAVDAVARDWAVRRAWRRYTVAPSPAPEARPEARASNEILRASGEPIRDWRACQSLVDALMEDHQVGFAPSTALLTPESYEALDVIGAALLRCHTVFVNVAGKMGPTVAPAGGRTLARAQAEAVVDYLVARGIPSDWIIAKGGDSGAPAPAQQRLISIRVVGVGDME